MQNKMRAAEFKALTGDGVAPGTFSAVVAVFGNVDKSGDRIQEKAFDRTLEEWRSKGDPIPIVLAHDWSNPFAHIGYADPNKVKSVPGIGLVVEEGHIDLDNPTGAQVHKLMERRTLKEFSFGYTVPQGGMSKAQDGAYDLTDVSIIEFGPCLKGVNDQTQLLSVKAQLDAQEKELSVEERVSLIEASVDRLVKALEVKHANDAIDKLDTDTESKAWNGDASNYTDEEYAKACILDRGADFSDGAKQRYGLPIATPGKSFSDPDPEGVHAAASRIGGAKGPADAIKLAYKRLVSAYTKIQEDPPQSVVDGAKTDESPEDDTNTVVEDQKASIEDQFAALEREEYLRILTSDPDVADVMGKSDSADATVAHLAFLETEVD